MNDPTETKLWDISHWPEYWTVNSATQPFLNVPRSPFSGRSRVCPNLVPVAQCTQSFSSSFLGQTAPSNFRAPDSFPPTVTSFEGTFCSSLTRKISYLDSVSKRTLENSIVAKALAGGWKQPSFLLNALSQHRNMCKAGLSISSNSSDRITNINCRSVCENTRESWRPSAELGKWATIKNSTQFELFIQLTLYLILSNIPFAVSEIFFPTVIGIFQYCCLDLGEGYISPFVTSSYILTLKREVRQPSWFSAISVFRSELFPWLTSGMDLKSWLRMLGGLGLINKLIDLKKGTCCEEKALRRGATWTAQQLGNSIRNSNVNSSNFCG